MSYTQADVIAAGHEPPRRTSRWTAVVAWIVILGTVAFVAITNAVERRGPAPTESDPAEVESVPLRLAGRYLVGARDLIPHQAGTAGVGGDASIAKALEKQATTAVDKLRLVTLIGELQGKDAAIARLNQFEQSSHDAGLHEDAELLRRVYADGAKSLSPTARNRLVARHGWFGKLALGFNMPDDDPARRAALAEAGRTIRVYLAGLALAITFFGVGLVLAIVALVRKVDGKLPMAYRPAAPDVATAPFVEAFAIYVAGFVGLPLAMRFVFPNSRVILFLAGVAPVALAIVWPLLRGTSVAAWRQGIGWHGGRGWVRELAAGAVGYIAGAPIIAAGILVTLAASAVSRGNATHPIVNYLGGDRRIVLLLFLLATVWAPLTEETLFRGALFHSLRGRCSWIVSAAIVSLLFAAVHPQGWVGVPALFSIAMVLAAIREWRGTILASAAAHAMNNGILLAIAIAALGNG